MKSLIEQLQQKAGLNETQARQSVEVFRDFLIENSYDPDLMEDVRLKTKAKYEKFSDKAEKLADKLSGKIDEYIHELRQEGKEAADKVSEYLDDKK